MGIVRELGRVCREVREERDLDHMDVGVYVQSAHGRDPRSLKGFEEGRQQPKHLDEVLSAYAQACGVSLAVILDRARVRLEATDDPLEELGGDPPSAESDSARTGHAIPNHPAAEESSG